MTTHTTTRRPAARSTPARTRLQPDVRISQILDAALVVFSEHGFAAARMEDIGQRCGLSKGGLYAHFASKEAVFEALMARSLAPPDLERLRPARPLAVRPLAEWLVDQLHDLLASKETAATLRLLIAESERVPHLVAAWYRDVIQVHTGLLAEILRETTAGTPGESSVLLREPWLVLAPAMHAMTMGLLLGHGTPLGRQTSRSAHVEMICEMLAPKAGKG